LARLLSSGRRRQERAMPKPSPAATLRLSEFLETLAEAGDPAPRETVSRLIFPKAQDAATVIDHAFREFLEIQDANGNVIGDAARILSCGADGEAFVSLRNAAAVFFQRRKPLPWRDKDGNPATIGRDDEVFIPYLAAKRILERRFPDATPCEIFAWAESDALELKSSRYADAHKMAAFHA
jgi:hypothetical protein